MGSKMPRISWEWSDSDRRFYKRDASGQLVRTRIRKAEDRGTKHPSGEGWTYSTYYNRWYKYEYGTDGTVLETLWGYPGPPLDVDADMRTWTRCSEWTRSDHYNSDYRIIWGMNEDVVLKTIWRVPSTREAEMLINSARKAVHFASHLTGYATTSHYIPVSYRMSDNDRDRQRDDRNDRNRHERSGHRDGYPPGDDQYPDNGDQLDDGDETQLSPQRILLQWPAHTSSHYPAPAYANYPTDQYPTAHYSTAQYPGAQYPAAQYPVAQSAATQYPAAQYSVAQSAATQYPTAQHPVVR